MIALLCLIALMASWGMWFVLDQPVQRYLVRGDFTQAERHSVEIALHDVKREGIFSTHLDDIKYLLADIPWARDLTLRRVWPDTIEIGIHRAQPIARWGQHRYVSAAGKLLDLPGTYEDMPIFSVAVDSPQQTLNLYRLLDQIFARQQLEVSRLQQTAVGEWIATLSADKQKSIDVYLGAEQINQRAHRFLLLYRRVLATGDRSVSYVDARYASGLAVRFADPEQELVANNDPFVVQKVAEKLRGY